MRTFTYALFALLAVCASAIRFTEVPSSSLSLSSSLGVDVPYKWCGASTDDATIDSIVSNEFPPVKGDTLALNVTGNLTKRVTSGTYTIAISVSGFPLPSITGDIDAFAPLPWELGQLNFSYSQAIPSEAPPGSYQVKISAVDQDSKQIFCISIAFSLSAGQVGQPSDVKMLSSLRKGDELQTEAQQLALGSAINQRPATSLKTAANNVHRARPQLRMPAVKPIKPLNRRR